QSRLDAGAEPVPSAATATPATRSSVASATGKYAGPGLARDPSGNRWRHVSSSTSAASSASPTPDTRSTVIEGTSDRNQPEKTRGVGAVQDRGERRRRQIRALDGAHRIVGAHVERVIAADDDVVHTQLVHDELQIGPAERERVDPDPAR